jgi:hypothetical protein
MVSSKKLSEYALDTYKNWADEPEISYAVGGFELGDKITLKELTEKLISQISEKL